MTKKTLTKLIRRTEKELIKFGNLTKPIHIANYPIDTETTYPWDYDSVLETVNRNYFSSTKDYYEKLKQDYSNLTKTDWITKEVIPDQPFSNSGRKN